MGVGKKIRRPIFTHILQSDIKPDNLLLCEHNVVKIVDFGVSEMFVKKGDDTLKSTAGSPAFMPPELLRVSYSEKNIAGKAADIWSMGVTLYCLVHGYVPFADDNLLALYEAIQHDQ